MLFVRVVREPLAVAESILRGRRDCFGSDSAWFSTMPSTFESLAHLAPIEQIAGELSAIDADMETAFARVGSERVFCIDYETFCRQPRSALADFADFYHAVDRAEVGQAIRRPGFLPCLAIRAGICGGFGDAATRTCRVRRAESRQPASRQAYSIRLMALPNSMPMPA